MGKVAQEPLQTVADSASTDDLFSLAVGLINRYNAIARQRRDFGTGVALSVSELHLIEVVGKASEPITATQIAQAMGITKGAVSQMMPRLEHAGILVRTPSPTDGRASLVTLTALGQTAFEQHAQVHERLHAAFEQAQAHMGEQSRADAAELIAAIDDVLDSLINEGKESS